MDGFGREVLCTLNAVCTPSVQPRSPYPSKSATKPGVVNGTGREAAKLTLLRRA